MRIAVVSLPWARTAWPSASLGTLAAFLRRERPAHPLECRLEFLTAAAAVGDLYEMIAEQLSRVAAETPRVAARRIRETERTARIKH